MKPTPQDSVRHRGKQKKGNIRIEVWQTIGPSKEDIKLVIKIEYVRCKKAPKMNL